MVQHRSLDHVHDVYPAGRRRAFQRRREHSEKIGVQVLVQRRAVTEDLSERRNGLLWAGDEPDDVFTFREGGRPAREGNVSTRELLLEAQLMTGES